MEVSVDVLDDIMKRLTVLEKNFEDINKHHSHRQRGSGTKIPKNVSVS